MFAATEKSTKPVTRLHRKAEATSFFAPRHHNAESQTTKTTQTFTPFSSFGTLPFFQPKLEVSQPGDAYEKEADATAETVMRMAEPAAPVAASNPQEETLQRQEEEKEEEPVQAYSIPAIQRMAEGEEEEEASVQAKHFSTIQRSNNQFVQSENNFAVPQINRTAAFNSFGFQPGHHIMRQSGSRGPPSVNPSFESKLQQGSAGGEALPNSTRQFMETRFQADFSGVRVHADTNAHEMSQGIQAHAFTHGNHIYFNSGQYDTQSAGGKTLLAHELTHTIQQGASPQQSGSTLAAKRIQPRLMRRPAQLDAAVRLAKGEEGKVIANQKEPDGNRVGWQRLLDYFKTTFGADKIVTAPTGEQNTVWEGHIKKKAPMMGQVPNQPDPAIQAQRDAMPSWCGIFVFWALNKSGVPMPKWRLGESIIKPEAAYPPGYQPRSGDIAYRNEKSHYGIVSGMEGSKIKSVNGNTAGSDNLGGEVQEQLHTPAQWDAFFNPLALATGSLRGPQEGDAKTEPVTLAEMRKRLQQVQRKAISVTPPAISNAASQAAPAIAKKTETVAEKTNNKDIAETGVKEESRERVGNQVIQLKQSTNSSGEDENNSEKSNTFQQNETPSINAGSIQRRRENGNANEAHGTPVQIGTTQTKTAASQAHLQRQVRAEVASRIHERTPGGAAMIQGGWFDRAWNAVSGAASRAVEWVEDKLNEAKEWLLQQVSNFVSRIRGYQLLCYILGYDPITGRTLLRTPMLLLESLLEVIPIGGSVVRRVLDYFQATLPVANWLFGAVNRFTEMIRSIGSRFERLWDSIGLSDVRNPSAVFQRVADLFIGIVNDIMAFVDECSTTFITMVKEIAVNNLSRFVRTYFPNAWDLLCVILGEDPMTHAPVARNGANILRAALTVMGAPGQQILRQMQENGIFDSCAGWVDRSIDLVLGLVSDIRNIFSTVWGLISFNSLLHPIQTFTQIAQAFSRPVNRMVNFLRDAITALVRILKEALLTRLRDYAKGARGYTLITVILGRDPFTGQTVERNAENLIRGFMGLMEGGEEQFRQLKESGAIDRTIQRVMAAVRILNFTLAYIVGLFTALWRSFSWRDFLNPIGVFARIIGTFAQPVRRLVAFVVEIVKIVVEILLQVMNFPIDIIQQIISRVIAVFHTIKRDPVGFLKNLLRAIKQGFVQFFDNILTHLLSGLADWFFFQLKDLGIQKPEDLSLKSILKLVMQVLGISLERIMDKVWKKLEEKIGKEKVEKIKKWISRLEGIWRFIKDVMERGPVAIWEFIQEKISNLWSMIIDAAKNWIMEKIVNAVITKLLSMLDPTGVMAVINSVIAIYRAIQSFIAYLRQMLEIVNSFVQGVAEIAAGNIRVAADFLERTAARAIPIIIGFLANQVGLGKVADKLKEIIEIVREKIDKAVDWLVDKAVSIGLSLVEGAINLGKKAIDAVKGWLGLEKKFTGGDGKPHKIFFEGQGDSAVLIIMSDPTPYTNFLNNFEKQLGDSASEEVDVGGKKKTKSQVIADARAIADAIEKEKRKKLATYSGAADKDKEANKATAIEKLLTDLAAVSVPLFGAAKDKPKDEEIVVPAGANNDMFAATQEARLIWKTPKVIGNGSGPSAAKHAIYDKINFRQKGDGSYYIRGHLINDNLGGPGNWNNMTALSRTANHEHEEKVESKVKAAYDTGAVVRYKVTTSGKQNVKKATASDKDRFTKIADFATALPYLEKITEAEAQIPNELICEAYMMKKEGDSWQDDKPIVTDTIKFNVGDFGDYELGELGGKVTLDVTKLKTEAAVSTGTFIQFKTQDKIHENSIALLNPEEIKELEKIFDYNERERNKNDELKTIDEMKMTQDIITWAAYATRKFFNTKDAAYNTVETAFKNKQTLLRKNAIDAAMALVDAGAPGAFIDITWQEFKIAQMINFKTEGGEGTDIEKIEIKFRTKQ